MPYSYRTPWDSNPFADSPVRNDAVGIRRRYPRLASWQATGADRFTANSFIYEGLRQEGRIVPPQEQSQNEASSPDEAEAGTLSTAIS
jgi:hypothetical protein